MTPPDDKSLEVLDAIYQDAALVEAELGESTPEEQRWAADVRSRLERRVAEMRRNVVVGQASTPKPIRPSLLVMARDALLTRIEQLLVGDQVQVAHRNLSTLSDGDLRRLLQSLEPDAE